MSNPVKNNIRPPARTPHFSVTAGDRDTSSSSSSSSSSPSSSSQSHPATLIPGQWETVTMPDGNRLVRMVGPAQQTLAPQAQHLGVIPAPGADGAPTLKGPQRPESPHEVKSPPASEGQPANEAGSPDEQPPLAIHVQKPDPARDAFKAWALDRKDEIAHFLRTPGKAVPLIADPERSRALINDLAGVAPQQLALFPTVPPAGATSWMHDLQSVAYGGVGLYMYAFGVGALAQRLASPGGPLAAHLAFGLTACPSSATLGAAFVGATRANYGGYTSPDGAGWTNCVTAYAKFIEAKTAGKPDEAAQCWTHLQTVIADLRKDINTRNGQTTIQAFQQEELVLKHLIYDLSLQHAEGNPEVQEQLVRAEADLAQVQAQLQAAKATPLTAEGLGTVGGAAFRSFLCDELPIAVAFSAFYIANGHFSVMLRSQLDGPANNDRVSFLAADLLNNWAWGILSGMGTVALQSVLRHSVENAPHPRGVHDVTLHTRTIERAEAEIECLEENERALSHLVSRAWGESHPGREALQAGAVTPSQVAIAEKIHTEANAALASVRGRIRELSTQVQNQSDRVRRDVSKGCDTLKGIVLGQPSKAVMKEFTGWPIVRRTIANTMGNLSYLYGWAQPAFELTALAGLYLSQDHLPGWGATEPNPHFDSWAAQQSYIDEGQHQMMPLAMRLGATAMACWAARFFLSPVYELSIAAVGGLGRRAGGGVVECVGGLREACRRRGEMPLDDDVEDEGASVNEDNVVYYANPIHESKAPVQEPSATTARTP
ncbi:MAG: hypothetical protein H7332_14940 [Bdellovibrionales bacterium]|nr:hypothetical protein [Ramlibacter sp.]